MEKTSSNGKISWSLNPEKFCVPDYLEFQKALKDHFKQFRNAGISTKDLMEGWEKCGVIEVHFESSPWVMGRRWGEIEGYNTSRFIWSDGTPKGWKDRYGTDVGYLITLRKCESSEIGTIVKQLAKEYPEGWGIKIKPKEFYRVLFFHEVAHTLPICGRFLNELAAMKPDERLKFEREAWLWGVKMARQKDPKIRILYPSVKKENKLEHSNFSQWYGLLKRDDEFRKRENNESIEKAA